MKNSKARNVIERSFGILKSRWAILQSHSYYPIDTQNKIIMACILLHNFIRTEMLVDPVAEQVHDVSNSQKSSTDFIDTIESSQQWVNWRDELAMNMFNEWRAT